MENPVRQQAAACAVALLQTSYPPDCPEIWADITGYEGHYQISTFGRVRSVQRRVDFHVGGTCFSKRVDERYIRSYRGTDGYSYVFISLKRKGKHFATHRLVALHFLLNPLQKREVNHLDRDRENTHVSNLAWVTPQENILYSRNQGVAMACSFGEQNPMAKLTKKEVLQIRDATGTQQSIADQFKVSRRQIGNIKKRKRWAHL